MTTFFDYNPAFDIPVGQKNYTVGGQIIRAQTFYTGNILGRSDEKDSNTIEVSYISLMLRKLGDCGEIRMVILETTDGVPDKTKALVGVTLVESKDVKLNNYGWTYFKFLRNGIGPTQLKLTRGKTYAIAISCQYPSMLQWSGLPQNVRYIQGKPFISTDYYKTWNIADINDDYIFALWENCHEPPVPASSESSDSSSKSSHSSSSKSSHSSSSSRSSSKSSSSGSSVSSKSSKSSKTVGSSKSSKSSRTRSSSSSTSHLPSSSSSTHSSSSGSI